MSNQLKPVRGLSLLKMPDRSCFLGLPELCRAIKLNASRAESWAYSSDFFLAFRMLARDLVPNPQSESDSGFGLGIGDQIPGEHTKAEKVR